MDTPAEREFLRSVMTGTISLNKNTLLEMAKMRKDIMEGDIAKFNQRINRGELDNFFSQSGITKAKVEMPGKGSFDLSTPEKIKEVRKFINDLSKTNPREAQMILNDFTEQLKRPKLTKEQARAIAKERGLINGE